MGLGICSWEDEFEWVTTPKFAMVSLLCGSAVGRTSPGRGHHSILRVCSHLRDAVGGERRDAWRVAVGV